MASTTYEQISIHALREEGDVGVSYTGSFSLHFYPRPPRGGRPYRLLCYPDHLHFYPRPPRGGRLPSDKFHFYFACISIHALREEGDFGRRSLPYWDESFLSTPSARRATLLS